MQELINLGLRQGALLKFTGENPIDEELKQGRFGPYRDTELRLKHPFVVLSQDCDIANDHEYIELAQLRGKKVKDEVKVEHLLSGRDYKKLYLKVDQDFYSLEEKLITKVNKKMLCEIITEGTAEVAQQLPEKDIRLLIDWRVQTYRRVPFPHNFNLALQKYLTNEGEWLYHYLVDNKDLIDSVRVYVSPFDVEDSDHYEVSFCVLFDDLREDQDVDDIHQELSKNLEKMVQEFDQIEGITCLQNIDFEKHDPPTIPEHLTLDFSSGFQEFTFANALQMREYNFQYICY